MFAYYPIRQVYHGYGQAGEIVGSLMAAAMAIYQAQQAKIAAKQARHEAARQRLADQQYAASQLALQQQQNYVATTVATVSGQPVLPGQQLAKPPMSTGMKIGLGVGAAALLVGGVVVLR